LKVHHGRVVALEVAIDGTNSVLCRVGVHWRSILVHRLISGILMDKGRRSKRWLRGLRLDERVERLKVVVGMKAMVESRNVHCAWPRIYPTFCRGHREGRSETHTKAQTGRVQITGLGMVDGVCSAWGGSVVSPRLAAEASKCKRAGIQQGRRESPLLISRAWCWVLVPEGLMRDALGSFLRSNGNLVRLASGGSSGGRGCWGRRCSYGDHIGELLFEGGQQFIAGLL